MTIRQDERLDDTIGIFGDSFYCELDHLSYETLTSLAQHMLEVLRILSIDTNRQDEIHVFYLDKMLLAASHKRAKYPEILRLYRSRKSLGFSDSYKAFIAVGIVAEGAAAAGNLVDVEKDIAELEHLIDNDQDAELKAQLTIAFRERANVSWRFLDKTSE